MKRAFPKPTKAMLSRLLRDRHIAKLTVEVIEEEGVPERSRRLLIELVTR